MRRKGTLLICGLLFVAALMAFGARHLRSSEPTVTKEPGWALNGADESHERARTFDSLVPIRAQEIIAKADKAEVFKLEGVILRYHIVDDGQKIIRKEMPDPNLSRELAGALGSPDTYRIPSGSKRCGGFQPREAVRFTLGRESVTFLICFKCTDIQVVLNDASGRPVHRLMFDFRPGRPELLRLMRLALPG